MLRKIRTLLAAVFLVGITLLFLDFTGTIHAYLGWMAKVQLLPAILALHAAIVVGLIILTLVFGRVYCSVICPLGVLQDLIARIGRHGKKLPYRYSPALNRLRYPLLLLMVVALVAGIGSVVTMLAPYTTFGRIASQLLQPVYLLANNGLAYLAERMDSYLFYRADIVYRGLYALLAAVASALLIGVLAWRKGRIYCNTICPIGTLLGLLARHAWFKIRIDTDKCVECGLCARHCKASCIDALHHRIDHSRCVVCGNCIGECRHGALSFSHVKEHKQEKPIETRTDASRRGFLLTALMATTALAQEKLKVDGGLAEISEKTPPKRTTGITPPGAMSAQNMAKHCTGCQLCISVCPNGVLRPSTGLMDFMKPTMSYEHGYCRPECTRCSEVCPAGAIRPIGTTVKSSTQIGHAVWVKQNCVAITDGVECGNCARHCPSGAITMVPYQTEDREVSIPTVDENRCIGCGACEYLCPARPFAAIYVEGHEVHKTI